jgi:hypothetical protein
MNAAGWFSGLSFNGRRAREEHKTVRLATLETPAPPAAVDTTGSDPILPPSAQVVFSDEFLAAVEEPTVAECRICDAFGQTCCKAHRQAVR